MSVEFWLTPSADYLYENPIRGRDITSATRYWTLAQDMPEQRSTVVLGLIRSLVPNIALGDIIEVINWPVWSDHAFSGIVTEVGAVKKGLVEVTVSGRDSLLANMRMDPFAGQMRDRDILHKLGLAMGFPSSSDPYYLDSIYVDKNYTWNSYRMTDRTGLDCLSDLNGARINVGDPLIYAYVKMTWDSGKVDGKPATHVVGKVHRIPDNGVLLPEFVQWRYTPTGGDIIGEPEYREDINAIVNSVTVVGDKVSATAEEAASIAKYGRRPRTYHAPWIVSQADAKVKAARLVSRLSILDTRVTVSRPRSSARPWPPEYMYWAEFDDQINGRYIYGRIIKVEFDSRKPTIRYTIGSPAMSSMSGSLFALSNELIGVKSGLDQSLKTTDAPTFAGASVGGLDVATHSHDGTPDGGPKVSLSNIDADADKNWNGKSINNTKDVTGTNVADFAQGYKVGGVIVINSARDIVNIRDIILGGGIYFAKQNDQLAFKDANGAVNTLWICRPASNFLMQLWDVMSGSEKLRIDRSGNLVAAQDLYGRALRCSGQEGVYIEGANVLAKAGSNLYIRGAGGNIRFEPTYNVLGGLMNNVGQFFQRVDRPVASCPVPFRKSQSVVRTPGAGSVYINPESNRTGLMPTKIRITIHSIDGPGSALANMSLNFDDGTTAILATRTTVGTGELSLDSILEAMPQNFSSKKNIWRLQCYSNAGANTTANISWEAYGYEF